MIGILGGTFNPIHIGHLRIAIEAIEKYDLEHIRFIPCKIPVHKKISHINADISHRLAMLTLALKPHKNTFVVDTCELDRKTPSYMIDTIKDLKIRFKNKTFALIIGSDILDKFHEWHKFEEILALTKLIVMPRDLIISSSDIRKRLKSKKEPKYLLPDVVLDYIKKQKLYGFIN